MSGHACILEAAVQRTPFLDVGTDRMLPRFVFDKPYRVCIEPDGLDVAAYDVTLFTDGSKSSCGSGAGIYSEQLGLQTKVPLGKYATVFQAELLAIIHGANIMADHNICGQKVLILTDSRAVLLALRGHRITSRLLLEAHDTLASIARINVVMLSWVKGHSGIEGNEMARDGGLTHPCAPEPIVPPTLKVLNSFINATTLEDFVERWQTGAGCRQARATIRPPCRTATKYYLRLSRERLRLLVGFLTGHCRLNKHLHTMGLVQSPLCRGCEMEDEDTVHVLYHCPVLAPIRGSVLGDYWPSAAEIVGAPPCALLQFILRVGWLG